MKISSMKYLAKEGIRNVWSNRMMSIASVGVLVSCLLLTGAAMLFSINVSGIMQDIEQENSFKVYLEPRVVSTLEAIEIGDEIQQLPNVADNAEFVSAEEGLEQFKDVLGDVYGELEEGDDFLPHCWIITMEDLSQYDETKAQIEAIDGVAQMSDHRDTVQTLNQLNQLVGTAGFWIVLILSIVSLFIIANTVRVTMFARRKEISIMKAVGATNWFIRIPFIIEGMLIGLLSALLATLLLDLLYQGAISAVNGLFPFFAFIPFSQFVWPILLSFVVAGMVFGALGGIISISKYLRKEGGNLLDW